MTTIPDAAPAQSEEPLYTPLRTPLRTPSSNPITARSVGGGIALMAFLAMFTPYAEYRMHSVELFQGELPIGALATLIVVLVPLNWLLARFRPAWRITMPEMIFMFVMGFAGIMVYHIGMMGLFLSMISSPDYFAAPENRYREFILPYLPSWAIPSNLNREMARFYVGMPQGTRIPWGVWVGPLFWWWSFFAAFLLVCSALTAILRKQWFDHEKVTFPQAEIPLALVQGSGEEGGLPHIMRNRLFWYGALVPFSFIAWNIVHYFTPLWPKINFSQVETSLAIQYFDGLYVKPDFFTIGFSYLVNTQIVFSLWFFRILLMFQDAAYRRMGVQAATRNDLWATSDALVAWQCLGGMVIWILWGLWMGRRHFRAVWERIRNPSAGADDSNELLSYRTSLLLLATGLLYMLFWLVHLGMAWPVALLFLAALVILVIAVTRIVAESGMPFVGAPVTAQGITLRSIGDANFSPHSFVGISLSLAAFRMIEGYPMPMVMHSARLGDVVRGRRRSLFIAIFAGSVIAMVLMSATTISLAYHGGAFNFGQHHAFHQMWEAYDHMVARFKDPWPRDISLYAHFLGGMAFIGLLLYSRYRFNWSGLHPVGFFTADTFYHKVSALSFFIAWLIKVLIVKVGGMSAYRRYKPFFIGLICGQVFGAMCSLVVDFFFFMGQGHDIYTGFAFGGG